MRTMALFLVLFSALAAPKAAISAARIPRLAQPAQAAQLTSQQAAALKLAWDNLLRGYADLLSAPPDAKGTASTLEGHVRAAMDQLHQLDPGAVPPTPANIPPADTGNSRQFLLDAVRGHLDKAKTVIEGAKVSGPVVQQALQNIAVAENDLTEIQGTPATAGSQAPPPAQPAVRQSGPVTMPQGITFRNFNGSNSVLSPPLSQQLGLGWNRDCIGLSSVEPQKGKWDWAKTDAAVQGAHAQYLEELFCLLGTGWASAVANNFGPAKDVHDWEDFVEQFVSHYSAPPFNLRYFEIWNEPTPGFWSGTDQQFVDLIYLPAAKIIRRHHCFVVLGGWALNKSIDELNQTLNYNNAWQWTDIINVHYRDAAVWQQLYNVWVKTGKCRGIWQTEVGFSSDPGLLPDVYLKTLYLALQSGWHDADQYKLFWFSSWGGGADADKCLTKGPASNKVLSQNGQHLATMSDVLGPGTLAAFSRFQTQPALPVAFGSKAHTALGFKVGANRTVIALLLDKATFTGNASLTFSIGLQAAPQVTELVTASGQRQQLHGTFSGGTWHVSVPMQSVQRDCPRCSFTVVYLRME